MKRFRVLFLSILIFSFLIPLFTKAGAFADQNSSQNSTQVQTGIFLPTSYLQYYKLDNPYALCRYTGNGEDFVAISHKDAIVIYKNEKFSSVPLQLGDVSVKAVQRYGNFLLFLYDSNVHYVDISGFEEDGWSSTPVNTHIFSANSFSIHGDYIVVHTSDYVKKYKISTDLSGGFTIDESTESKAFFQNSAMLLLSPSGEVYCSKIGQDGIFSWQNADSPIIQASNVESLICTEDGSTLYYSCPTGVYGVDMSAQEKTPYQITASAPVGEEPDLGNVYSPKGICLVGDKLWIVDGKINAVQEIDLAKDNSFTEFAITTNSKAINRLTAKVKDIAVDKERIYALDEGRIVVINDIATNERTYNRINLVDDIECFAVGNDYICYYTGEYVHVCKITPDEENELIFNLSNASKSKLANVVDITYSENAFYLITTETIDNDSHPVAYKIDLSNETLHFESVLSTQTSVGSAYEIAVDVFGTIYYCAKEGDNYEFYSYDGKTVEFLARTPITSTIRNLQTDFDGKLYALYDQNSIEIIEKNSVTAKTLKTSANLGEIAPAKSMCLSCNSQTAYFIFEGLILSSSAPSDLNVATPHTIDIPQGFSTAFNANQTFAKVKKGAKLFKIDLSELSGEHFKFVDYTENLSASEEYAVISLDEKYSLLIKDGVSAVARNSDIESAFSVNASNYSRFANVKFATYSLPVLEKLYKTENLVDKFKAVTIVGEITFNGVDYCVVKDGENFGYIPKSFLVESIVTEDGNVKIDDVYVYKKGGVAILDGEGNQLGVFEEKTKVTVLKRGNLLTILYGDGIAYVDSACIVPDSTSDVMKSVAVLIASISVCITALYLENRFLTNNG